MSIIIIVGIMTISKHAKDKPEDDLKSSGYSIVRGNMSNINNYSNVIEYNYENKYESVVERHEYKFLEEIELIGKDEYPQGLCITDDYVFVSAYSGNKNKMGIVRVYDVRTGECILTLGMDESSHLGGITFDGTNIWVCNSSKMSIEKVSYEFVKNMIFHNRGKVVDVRHLIDSFRVKNIPSTISYYNGQLWIATHTVLTNAKMISYQYFEKEMYLASIGTFNIPKKVQGVSFSEEGEVYLSVSYGRKQSSYVLKYESIHAMSKDIARYKSRIELPPCSEGLVYLDKKLYILFESAGTKYLEGTDGKGKSLAPLDKILVISTS